MSVCVPARVHLLGAGKKPAWLERKGGDVRENLTRARPCGVGGRCWDFDPK